MTTDEQFERVPIKGWQKWVLSLDKYIDPADQPKKRRYGFVAGVVLCPIVFLLHLVMGLPKESALVSLLLIWMVIGPVLGSFDSAGWRRDRETQCLINKSRYFYDRDNLRPYPEKGWLKSRVLEHYICTVYEIHSSIWEGWAIPMAVLWLLSWLFDYLTK